MRVVFDEKNKVFLLHTQNTTYAIDRKSVV